MPLTQLSSDSPTIERSRKGKDSRNPTPTGRRIREKTPKRMRGTTPIKIREKTPGKRGKTPKPDDKNRSRTPAKNLSGRSRNTTPARQKGMRDKTPVSRRMSPLGTKKGTSIKIRPKTRGLFKKGGGKKKSSTSDLPPRAPDAESITEENPPKPPPVTIANVAAAPIKPEDEEIAKKKKSKKKSKRSKSPAVKTIQPKEEVTPEVPQQCGSNPFLKKADDAVLGIGYYFGKGIVTIMDGVKDGTLGCAQSVKAQAPATNVVDRFTCRAPTFDTGYTGIPMNYDSGSTATNSKYLYDDEGNRVERDSFSKQY